MKSIWSLLLYNIKTEYRVYAQSLSIILFSWIVSYVIYRLHPALQMEEFGFLFWTFMMLIGINICLRAETHHGSSQHLFLYTLVDPESMYIAKFLFNWLYLTVMGILFYGFFIFYFSPNIVFNSAMLVVILVGGFGLSGCISFVAAMSSYAGGQSTLVSILAVPLLIPIIILLKSATDEIILFNNLEYHQFLTLLSISLSLVALSVILFPFVWKE